MVACWHMLFGLVFSLLGPAIYVDAFVWQEIGVARLGFEPRSAGPKPTMMDPYTIGLCESVGAVPLFVSVGFAFSGGVRGRLAFFGHFR